MAERVLIDFLAASTGGQMTRARAFLARLRQHDPDSEFWALQENDALGPLLARPDLHVVNVKAAAGALRPLRRIVWQNAQLPRLAREIRASVFLSFSHYLPWTLPRGIRTIIGVSNLAPFSADAMAAESRWRGRLRLAALRRTIVSSARRSDSVVALSHACRDILVAHGVDAARIHVIPNGVEPHESAAAGGSVPVLPREYVLYVSHFYPYKNHLRLIDAYAAVPPALRDRYGLVLVGVPYDRDYYAAVKNAVARHRIGERVTVVPGLAGAPLAQVFRGATLFVYPSLVENCPNSLLEAMAYELPVIAGGHVPMPEFGSNAARYFDAHSVVSITKVLAAALGDEAGRETMRGLSRAQAARFSWDAFTANVVALYRGEPHQG